MYRNIEYIKAEIPASLKRLLRRCDSSLNRQSNVLIVRPIRMRPHMEDAYMNLNDANRKSHLRSEV